MANNKIIPISITVSITVGFLLPVTVFFAVVNKMGYNVAERRERQIDNRDKIIERIDSYIAENKRVPDSLFEAGFEFVDGKYWYKGMIFKYTRLTGNDLMVEYFSEDGALMRFSKSENCWREEP